MPSKEEDFIAKAVASVAMIIEAERQIGDEIKRIKKDKETED